MKNLIVILIYLSYGKSLSLVNNKNFVPLSNELIDYVNSVGTTWKAGKNFDNLSNLPLVKKLVGTLIETGQLIKPKIHQNNKSDDYIDTVNLPDYFDSREVWPFCDSIATIRDQGACGSCWAVNTISSMSDRLCIKSNGTINVQLSADEVLSCCGSTCGFGCQGGYAQEAFYYWIDHGIVTGGPFQGEGCLPYSIQPCEHHVNGSRPSCEQLSPVETPYCMKKCVLGYEKNFTSDKFYGEKVYTLGNPLDIMTDILTNGPVSARIHVYTDFYIYKSGVYQYTIGESQGYHTVKLIGWGNYQGVDYWLAANSWNTDWGDNGLFKIKRGTNECDIESDVISGLPKL